MGNNDNTDTVKLGKDCNKQGRVNLPSTIEDHFSFGLKVDNRGVRPPNYVHPPMVTNNKK